MNENDSKRALAIVSLLCLALAAALGYLVWQRHQPATAAPSAGPFMAKGPDVATPAPVPAPVERASLTPVQLSPQRLQAIGVTTAVAEMRNVSAQLRVPGNVAIDDRRLAYVQTRFPGWIQKVFANATYQYVRKGQPLFAVYSPDLVSTEQEYLLAKQNQQAFATSAHGTAAQEAGWLLQAATDRLRQFGVSAGEIARLEQTSKVEHDVVIDSPASGYVTEFNALPNQYVQAETRLYTLADLSTVWVNANVFQADVGALQPGTPASVTVDAYPGRTFRGRIEQVVPQVDAATRTVPVRFVFSNPGVALKPGMYVDVTIAVPLGRQLVIPASAVLRSGTRQIAFLDHGGGSLEPREIEVGQQLDDHVVVLSGLHAGDRIVDSANFLLDSESQLQAAIGSFAPPASTTAPGTGASPPAQLATIAFTTDPSPPRKGTNAVRVVLAGADLHPVAGAEVTATFFMPPMPAMGMPAMQSAVTLHEKTPGVYEGTVDLANGGSWQVTVRALRGGQPIAGKELTVRATGGM